MIDWRTVDPLRIRLVIKDIKVMAIETGAPPVAENVETSVDTLAEDVGDKGKKPGRVKEEDDPRDVFVCTEDMLDEGGRIKDWPEDCEFVYGGEANCNRPIKKDRFASEEIFVDYRIGAKRHLVHILEDDIKLMRKSRDQFSSIENLDTRTKMKKAQKLRNEVRKLCKQLKSDGINVDDLMDED